MRMEVPKGSTASHSKTHPSLPGPLRTICHAENLPLCRVIREHPCFIAGLLGAPPAMPLLSGPALSTALLQLALQSQSQSQSQKVTAPIGGSPTRLLTFLSALESCLGLVSVPEVNMTKKAQP